MDVLILSSTLRFDGVRQHRFRERERGEAKVRPLLRNRVVGAGVLELGDGADVAGLDLGHRGLRLALHMDQMPQAL
jgi:hypothetical protein